VGFNDHKQEIFNLVQSLKTLFLYTQSDKETVAGTPWRRSADHPECMRDWCEAS